MHKIYLPTVVYRMYICYILYICTCGFTISWYLYRLFNVFLLFRRLFLLFEGFSCMCSYVSYFSYCFSYFWNAGKLKKINLLLWKRRFPNFRRISECTLIVFLYSVYLYSFSIFPGILQVLSTSHQRPRGAPCHAHDHGVHCMLSEKNANAISTGTEST